MVELLCLAGLGSLLACAPRVEALVGGKHPVPPSKGGGVVALESHMVVVVKVGATPEWHYVSQGLGKGE